MDRWSVFRDRKDLNNLDIEVLRSLDDYSSDSEESLAQQVIKIYLEVTPAVLEKIKNGLATKDGLTIRKEVHSLRSSSANVGATEVAQLCAVLEKKLTEDESEKSVDREEILKLVAAVEGAQRSFREILGELTN